MDVNKPSKKKRKYKNVTSKNSIKQYLKQKQNIGSQVKKSNRRRYSTSDSSDIVDTDVKRKTTDTRKESSKSNERRKKIPVPKWKSTPKASHTPHQQQGHSPHLEDVMEEISSISNASLPYSVHSNVTQVSTTSTAGTVSESSGSESRSIEQVRPSVTVKTKARRRKKSGFLMRGYNKSKSKAGSPRSSKKQSPKWKSTPKVRHTPLGQKDNDEIDGLSAIGMDMHTRFVNSRTMGDNTIRGASSSSRGRVSPSTITTSPIRAKRRKLSEVLKHLSEQKQKGLTKSQNHSVDNERSGNAKDNGRSTTHLKPGSINHEQGSVSAEISNITNSIQQQLNEPSSEEQNSKSLNTRKSTVRKNRRSTLELFRKPKRKSDGSPRSSKKQSPKWKSTPKVRHTPLGQKDNDEIDGLSAIGMDMHTRFVNSRTMGDNTIRGASSSSRGRVSPSTITTSPIRAKRRKISEVLQHLSERSKQKGLTKSQNHSVENERSGNAKDNGRSTTHQEPGSINHEQGSVSAEISNITNSIQQQLNEQSSEEQNSKSLTTRKSTGRKKRKSTLELFRKPKRKSDDVLPTSIRSEKATTLANKNEKAMTKNVSKATLPSKQRKTSPTKQRNTSPTEQRDTSPTKQRKTSPTKQRKTSPTKQRNTSPTEQRDTSPTKQRKTSPTKQRKTSPTKQRNTSPTEQRDTSPTKQRKTIPANNRTRSPVKLSETRPPRKTSPTKHRNTSPAKHRNASPAKHRNASPAKHRNVSPAKHRNASPAKHRNASPAKQRNASPAKQRKISPANQKRSSSNVRSAVVKRDKVRTTKQRTKAPREPGPKPKRSHRRSAIQSSHSENDDSDDSDVFTTIRFTDRQRAKWGAVSQRGKDYVNSAVDNIINDILNGTPKRHFDVVQDYLNGLQDLFHTKMRKLRVPPSKSTRSGNSVYDMAGYMNNEAPLQKTLAANKERIRKLIQSVDNLDRTIEELEVKKRRLTEQSKDVVPETVVPDFLQNLLEQTKGDDCRVPEFTKPQGSYQLALNLALIPVETSMFDDERSTSGSSSAYGDDNT